MTKEKTNVPIPDEIITRKIYFIRGKNVMLDQDLAELYDVETKRLNEQVKRNLNRFPDDFMFQLYNEEFNNLRSQIATANWEKRRTNPYAFTEHGCFNAKRKHQNYQDIFQDEGDIISS